MRTMKTVLLLGAGVVTGAGIVYGGLLIWISRKALDD